MEQLLQLQRLKATTLAGVTVLPIATDPPEKTRAMIEKVHSSKDVALTHRFLSDPELKVTDAYGIRNSEAKKPIPQPRVAIRGGASLVHGVQMLEHAREVSMVRRMPDALSHPSKDGTPLSRRRGGE